jgi:hypothetical protein
MQPLLQNTFDSAVRVLAHLPEWSEETLRARPNMRDCATIFLQMQNALMPTSDFNNEAQLTIDEIAGWRDRLKSGFSVISQARYLWIADSLGFGSFDPNL